MFLAYIIQPNGCDYTIACGETVIELEAADFDSAVAELRKCVTENYRGDTRLSEATLLQVTQKIAMPIDEWYEAAKRQEAEQERLRQEQRERELYEKLKHRFG